MFRLIIDWHGRKGLLTKQEVHPEPGWLALQSKPPLPTGRWFTAYPLSGGAVSVQEETYRDLGPAKPEHIIEALDTRQHGFNPASHTIIKMLLEAAK